MQVAATQATRGAVSIALAVTLGHFINDGYGAMLTPLGPALRGQYGVSIASVTLLASVFSLTSSVLQPLLGVIGERFDRRLMAAAGPALTGIGLTFMGYAPAFGLLMLLVALAGFGSGFFHPAGAAYTARYSPVQQRGLWASIFSAGGTAGMALGPVFAGVGLHALPIFAPIGLLVAGISYVITPSDRPQGTRPTLPEYLGIFRGPLVRLWAMAVLRSLASMGYNAMLPFIMLQRGFGHVETASTLAVFAVASAVGGIVGGRISDRIGRVPVLRSAIMVTIPLFALLIYSSPSQWWFYPLTFLVGALVNASIPVGVVMAQEYAPKHVAVASSIMMGFSWGFAGLLVFLVGLLADHTSPVTAALLSLTLMVPSAFLAASLPEPEKQKFE
ncbi:MFS transporter [Deinococcus ruber]|uniref:MFS transporter n=1 Tax=Deinococcus ruber TaxID=1848197 RepID=A0A918C2B3_9DEIO|nr:MFS transporter [Deinococcus ruber]GGR02148.1 MFS transporter [Deinococcus ruber]